MVCVYVSLSVCYQHNSETNYSRNIKFGIQHFYHIQMLLETFHEDRTKTLCTGTHKDMHAHRPTAKSMIFGFRGPQNMKNPPKSPFQKFDPKAILSLLLT